MYKYEGFNAQTQKAANAIRGCIGSIAAEIGVIMEDREKFLRSPSNDSMEDLQRDMARIMGYCMDAYRAADSYLAAVPEVDG